MVEKVECEYTITPDIQKQLKEKQLYLLSEFLKICKRNNIRYFLIGGSALGAVRHKGFIPWDDDIDVGMPRPDYERFVACAQALLPDDIFLQTHYTDKEYLQNFAKLRDNNTTFIESSCRNLNMNHGIYIDLFPIDGAGESEDVGKKQFEKIAWYSRPIFEKFDVYDDTFVTMVKRLIKKIWYIVLFPNINKCIEKREELYKENTYEASTYVANYGGAWSVKEIVPKSFFGAGCLAEFEGFRVNIPAKYQEYLTHVYGDYMTPPPPEKRIAHHYCDAIDTEKSYKEYLKR